MSLNSKCCRTFLIHDLAFFPSFFFTYSIYTGVGTISRHTFLRKAKFYSHFVRINKKMQLFAENYHYKRVKSIEYNLPAVPSLQNYNMFHCQAKTNLSYFDMVDEIRPRPLKRLWHLDQTTGLLFYVRALAHFFGGSSRSA